MLTLLVFIFEKNINDFSDFNFYVNNPTGPGPNLGFRWIIYALDIKNINEITPILLALFLNISIDILWICLLQEYLDKKSFLFFIFLLATQPYVATYTIKFSSIIFAKLSVLYFFWRLKRIGTSNSKIYLIKEFSFWTIISLVRNSNIFIFILMIIWWSRKNILLMIISVLIMSYISYYITLGYLDGINPANWPWNLDYAQNLFGIDNMVLLLLLLGAARILLLFGAREKMFTEGIEPFLTTGLPFTELIAYLVLALFQIFGMFCAIKFFYKKHLIFSLIVYFPLLLSVLTVSHARYLIPYVPVCMFGLALMMNKPRLHSHDE